MYILLSQLKMFFADFALWKVAAAVGVGLVVLICCYASYRYSYDADFEDFLYINIFGFTIASLFVGIFQFIGINMMENLGYLFHFGIFVIYCLISEIVCGGFFKGLLYFVVHAITGTAIGLIIGWLFEVFLFKILLAILPIVAIVAFIAFCCINGGGSSTSTNSGKSNSSFEYVRKSSTGANYRRESNIHPNDDRISVINDETGERKILYKTGDKNRFTDGSNNDFITWD